jgi:hypothetical protein
VESSSQQPLEGAERECNFLKLHRWLIGIIWPVWQLTRRLHSQSLCLFNLEMMYWF